MAANLDLSKLSGVTAQQMNNQVTGPTMGLAGGLDYRPQAGQQNPQF